MASVLSKLTVSWFSPLLTKGWRKPLETGDLIPLPQSLTCESAYHCFLRGLTSLPEPPEKPCTQQLHSAPGTEEQRVNGDHPSTGSIEGPASSAHHISPEQRLCSLAALLRLIWRLHGRSLRAALALIYAYQICTFFPPVLLRELTNQLTHGKAGDGRIWVLPLLLFVSPLVGSVCKTQSQLTMIRIQIGLRSQLTAAVYRKCLRLSAGARAGMPSGRVVNIMSADVAKICDFLYPQLTFISAAPLAVSVALLMLWFQIGWATLVGLGVLLLSTPVSHLAVKATQHHRNEMLRAADGRMKLVGQFLVGVRVIKMYAWERPQQVEIEKYRAEELRALRNMIPSKVAMQTLLYVLPQLAGLLSFLAVGLTDPKALTPATAFSSLVLFQIMRFPLLTLSTGLVELGAAVISARRITSFMAAEEQVDYVTRLQQPPGTASASTAASRSSSPPRAARSQRPVTAAPRSAVAVSDSGKSGDAAAQRADDAASSPPRQPQRPASLAQLSSAVQLGGVRPTPGGSGRGSGNTSGSGMVSLSLAGVEPGLTIRAAGFRWAPAAAAQHAAEREREREKEKREGLLRAGGATGAAASRRHGPDGGGGSFRRVRSSARPLMEVVDAAGESLSSGAVALGARLTRAFTRRRDIDATTTCSAGSSPLCSPHAPATSRGEGGGGGGDSAFRGPSLAPHQTSPAAAAVDEERLGLLSGRDDKAAGTGAARSDSTAMDAHSTAIPPYGGKPPVVGGSLAIMVAFDSSSALALSASRSGTASGSAPASESGSGHGCEEGGRGGGGGEDEGSGGAGSAGAFALGEIELRVRPGELVCVVGRVGSGKSSLVCASLGEMEAELGPGGVVGLGGRVAYVAQQAWIINASLVENVTMGKPLDEDKWARCVEACALGPDLALMPAGRDTEIGEKGLNLSGGQKQRLSLARAMYQEADIYLLDDPLSAVDVHVGAHIFNSMIRGALAGAAVLLVTNGVQYLPTADRVVVMDAGRIVVQGPYSACLAEPLFASLLEEFRAEQQQQGQEQGDGGQEQQRQGKGQREPPAVEAPVSCQPHLHQGAGEGTAGDQPPSREAPLSTIPTAPSPFSTVGPAPAALHPDSSTLDHHPGHYPLLDTSCAPPHRADAPAGPLAGGGVAGPGLEGRRASVECVRASQSAALEAALRPGWRGRHAAELDEGNEMLDSLRRMSGDGGGGGEGEVERGAEAEAKGSGTRAERREERRPLLSPGKEREGGGGAGDEGGGAGRGALASGSKRPRLSSEAETPTEEEANAKATAPAIGVSVAVARKGRITVAEDRELGQVKMRVYGAYMSAFHPVAALAMLMFWSVEQATRLGTNAWLAHWSRTTQQQHAAASASSAAAASGGGLGRFSVVYLLLGLAYAVATFLRSSTNNLGSYRASKLLHARTLAALVAAPLSFFEATPVGRILNRLSRDVDEMDYNLAMYQQQLGNCVMRLVATILFLCILQPAFVGVVIPLMVIYIILQKYFRRSSIELQRIDSVSRSPVYANFAETMTGLDTIRAYRMQERFKSRHEAMVDTNATAYFNARIADEWLSLRLDLLGSTIVLSVACLNVGLSLSHSTWGPAAASPALLALALAEAIDLTSFLNYAVKVSALVESRYNAVERLLAYAQLEPEEGGLGRSGKAAGAAHGAAGAGAGSGLPPHRPEGLPAWPSSGQLEFRDVWMSYRPGLDPVLQGVSFRVLDGQKVGIVGRTGSGKSSLIVALFRLVEPQRGQMLLDGVDLRGLRLQVARTAISAIPQEPVLFAGSVRSNLDPWGAHADAELWGALAVVALRDHVRGLGGLSAAVAEGGSNFSVGQRQLVCVARALLRQPRLLVADEATASVDPETDGLIQRALRLHFKSSTVLTIAHRLNTILDSDAVLLMDAGRVAEFGPVPQLMANRGSAFAAMVRDAGLDHYQPASLPDTPRAL